MKLPRSSGVLLHPVSLPGPYGIGDIGSDSEEFLQFLLEAGQRFWQVLPLGPTGYGDSPYQAYSSFAGNPLLISPDVLLQEGLLDQEDLENRPSFLDDRIDYGSVIQWKSALLRRAHQNFLQRKPTSLWNDFLTYCEAEKSWLDDFALFMALKETHGYRVWTEWETELIQRDPAALSHAAEKLASLVESHKFVQFEFAREWQSLHNLAAGEGILIIGDIPFYVAHDSADVWANQNLFRLDKSGNPVAVAGVPPDYFSETGQLWGNPTYRWDVLEDSGFAWWCERVKKTLTQVDVVRLDHFRGFEAYWEVPAGEPTAERGEWVKGPGAALFQAIKKSLNDRLPIIAENLGLITEEVEALREQFQLPGMAVFQFGFGHDAKTSAFPLHKYTRDLVAYTGTHDNETLRAWWDELNTTKTGRATRRYIKKYLSISGKDFNWSCIRALMASVADVVIFPMQDLLGLGKEARMNRPGISSGNWAWRMPQDMLTSSLTSKLKELVELYGRDEGAWDGFQQPAHIGAE
ncbi:MAG TPA: 4-alpha-glucanotransferase [Candidatus Hydrogenedentes bacterium]|nr:4-alpha-glucanotransferase [Candidatus Hydrogenedentota bacterium]HOL76855.1 4-alpha-glucanotransferase [Candidatus Hydrogenedentota bacterium]HPO85506.1 4-alpha-glucanotransferase [Candidatus Hydrogenedentota bacterium]